MAGITRCKKYLLPSYNQHNTTIACQFEQNTDHQIDPLFLQLQVPPKQIDRQAGTRTL